MKKPAMRSNNFTDALATEMAFAVLTKTGRIQVLIKPTAKQLRKRGKRGWQLFGVVDDQSDARKILDDTLRRAILEVEGADRAPDQKKKKRKQEGAGK
jgi:hypothetical protein